MKNNCSVFRLRISNANGRGHFPRILRSLAPRGSKSPEVLGVPGLHGILRHWKSWGPGGHRGPRDLAGAWITGGPRGPRAPRGPRVKGLGLTFLPCQILQLASKNADVTKNQCQMQRSNSMLQAYLKSPNEHLHKDILTRTPPQKF